MSALRSALDELLAENLTGVDADQLAEDLVELELASGLIEAERARRLDRYQRAGGLGLHGFSSLTAFLMERCRIASGRARRLVAMANAAAQATVTFRGWVEQRLSTDQAHRLFEVADAVPVEFAAAEETLVFIVEPLSPGDTKRALDYWRYSVDHWGPEREEATQHHLRSLSVSETMGGMGRIDGWLTKEALQTLRAALESVAGIPDADDGRTPRQRRHDALEDLARGYLDHADTPTAGGEKPHVNLICDLDALAGVAGGRHEYDDGTVVNIDTLRRIACDSSVSRIVLGPNSEIIDVGRRTRTIPAALRRAVVARDRHCTYGNCTRPARWCDVHHRNHWADGGESSLDNLELLCRHHHTITHRNESRLRAPP